MEEGPSDLPWIDITRLPDISQPQLDFRDTSFFQQDPSRHLPTPEFILEQNPDYRAGVLKFEDLKLAVKIGFNNEVRLEEAQTLRAIKEAFPNNEVPVPELFGWRKHGDRNFIYMSLVEGRTLHDAWSSFTESEKQSVCAQLNGIVASLRKITCKRRSEALIGSINGGSVQDRYCVLEHHGPFSTVQAFNNWVMALAIRQIPQLDGYMDGPYRELMPDESPVNFTHGDLTLTNIVVSEHPDGITIVSLVDWEQAGWYPEYWEYCKALCGVDYEHEWREAGWVDTVMRPCEDEWAAFSEYTMWRRP